MISAVNTKHWPRKITKSRLAAIAWLWNERRNEIRKTGLNNDEVMSVYVSLET